MTRHYDLVIIGGGLAGTLFLAGLKHTHPKLRVCLLEKNSHLGGNHTWCFHDHDIPNGVRPWLMPLISKTWSAYDVKFPSYERTLHSAYHCIRSHELDVKITAAYQNSLQLNQEVLSWEKQKGDQSGYLLKLSQGQTLVANSFIDARGWIHSFNPQQVAWQKFVGLEVKLKKAHGLENVLLKDVTIPQVDGYRFIYILPFTEDTLLVEDTYFSNHSILKTERIEKEIEKYIKDKGWEIESILRQESGCLPLTLYPERKSTQQITATSLGAASLCFNPVTGYTFPHTIRSIHLLLEKSALTQESMIKFLQIAKEEFSTDEKYFRFLNRMMFLAAEPLKRYKILERFYRLNEALIKRFYSGQLKTIDRFQILFGKPPVSIFKALRVISE